MTAVTLCTSVAIIGSAMIYQFRSQKPFCMRLQYSAFSVIASVILILFAPIYSDLTEQYIFSYYDAYLEFYKTDVEIGKFELSDTYGYVFMILMCILSFLLPIVYAIGQSFGKITPKYTHFWGFFTLYVLMVTGLSLNCYFMNERFTYLFFFLPVFAVLFTLMFASVTLDVTDLKQFVTLLVINILLCGATFVIFVLDIIFDPAGAVFTYGTIPLAIVVIAFCVAGIALPIIAKRKINQEAKA